MAKAFDFPSSSHLFDDYVRKLISGHNYVAAAQVAQHTGLVHEDFLYGFLVPMSFSRAIINSLYDYLTVAKELKEPLMRLLDSFLADGPDSAEKFNEMMAEHKYKDLPPENLTKEYLRKNIPKLRKSLELPMDGTPNSAKIEIIRVTTFRLVTWIKKLLNQEIGNWRGIEIFTQFWDSILS